MTTIYPTRYDALSVAFHKYGKDFATHYTIVAYRYGYIIKAKS